MNSDIITGNSSVARYFARSLKLKSIYDEQDIATLALVLFSMQVLMNRLNYLLKKH